jgi:hypothetical protein
MKQLVDQLQVDLGKANAEIDRLTGVGLDLKKSANQALGVAERAVRQLRRTQRDYATVVLVAYSPQAISVWFNTASHDMASLVRFGAGYQVGRCSHCHKHAPLRLASQTCAWGCYKEGDEPPDAELERLLHSFGRGLPPVGRR